MKQTKAAYLLLLVSILGVSCSNIFARFSLVPSMTLATLRMLITMVLFSAGLLVRGTLGQMLRGMSRRHLVWCAVTGLIFALHLAFSFEAVRNTSIAAGSVLLSTEVIFVALGGLAVGSRIDRTSWALILIAFAGSAVVAFASSTGGSGPRPLYGCTMAVVSSILGAVYTLISSKLRGEGLSTTSYTYVMYGFCALALIGLDLVQKAPVLMVPAREYLIALGLAVCSTFLGHSLFSYCLKFLHPAHVSAGKLLIPVASGIAAIPLFGEVPPPLALAGCAVVMVTILIYTLRDARAREAEEKARAQCP